MCLRTPAWVWVESGQKEVVALSELDASGDGEPAEAESSMQQMEVSQWALLML